MSEETTLGFDGLLAYRTDVDAAIAEADRLVSAPPVVSPERTRTAGPATPTHQDSGALIGGIKKLIGSVGGIAISIVMIALVVGLKSCVFQAFRSGGGETSSSAYDATTSTSPDVGSNTMTAPDTDAPAPGTSEDTADAAASDDGTTMTKPLFGSGALDIAELRYCLAEGIRMAAEKSEMDIAQTADTEKFNRHVDKFNANVDDFNSTCSSRSYPQSIKPLADSQVEARRSTYAAEGKNRVD